MGFLSVQVPGYRATLRLVVSPGLRQTEIAGAGARAGSVRTRETMETLERRYAQGRFGRFAPTAAVLIHAPVETVWDILVDFGNYQAWNRFTPSVECSGVLGASVEMQVCFPGARPMKQVEVLNVFEPPHRLAWGVIMGTPAILVANRYQTLEATPDGRTRYTTVDYVSGLLAPVVKLLYAESMRAGFQLAADGLKAHAETAVQSR